MRIPTANSSTRTWPDVAPVLALLAVPLLGPSLVLPASVLLLALFVTRRPSRRDTLAALLGTGLAVLLLLAGPVPGRRDPDPDRLQRRAEAGFERLWSELDRSVDRVAEIFPEDALGSRDATQAFEVLSHQAALTGEGRHTLLLVGPRGQVAAWAGPGLLHDLEGRALPNEGSELLAGFSAASLLAVRSLEEDSSGWRVVAGISLSVEQLPFGPGRRAQVRHPAWLGLPAGAEVPDGFVRVGPEGRPAVAVRVPDPEGSNLEITTLSKPAQRLAWLVVALTLTLLAASRREGTGRRVLGVGVGLGITLAAGLGPGLALLATLTAGFAFRAWTVPGPGLSRLTAAVAGGLSGLTVAVSGFLVQQWTGPMDLGSGLWPSIDVLAWRLVLFSLVLGLLGLVRDSRSREKDVSPAILWGAILALGLAAATHERTPSALLLLLVAGVLTAAWLRRGYAPGTIRSRVVMAVLAALIAAIGWETAYRASLGRDIAGPALAALGPPTATDLRSLSSRLDAHFSGLDLEALAPAGPAGLESQDLAYEIWRHSPLARGGVLSAVSVSLPGGGRSAFSFGIPTTEEGDVDWSPARWDTPGLPVWDSFVMAGEELLGSEGRTWGRVRFWQLLRPGFRIDEPIRDDLAVRLLRGGPSARNPTENLPGPTHYALYAPGGRARISPWKAPPGIPPELQPAGEGVLRTPDGVARVYTATGDDGLRALFMMRLAAIDALEHVGAHALGLLFLLSLMGLGWWLASSRWQDLVDVVKLTLRSYSKRLLLVYSVLALVPLLLANAVFVRVVSGRLESEQLAAGSAALESAQRVLGEYLLSLEPGFGIDSALDNELLGWLSGVVQHEVNLYWRSSVWASSRPELFTAGLLPARIPGEIHSRLSRGDELTARTNRTGDVEYLELYAPLRVPGMPTDEEVRLVISTPLLAQQEMLAEDLASLRLRALLATTFLGLVLAGLGARLAKSFSDPLMEVVQGTQRIAAGETSLELAPTETELATLVGAIDRMAAKIADGRAELVREKRMVESMVESITSGVVSLDVERRVMLRNRVATELLGVEVGEPMDEALSRQEALRPVLDFLRDAGGGIVRRTVQLVDSGGEEREWSLVWVPLTGSGEPTALLVVEDVTEVLRGQRLEAWAEMARIIAHEIKNPLTPIRLSAEHMREVHERDPEQFDQVFESCTTNILRQVRELQQISSEFSTYSRIPRIEPKEDDLSVVVRDIVEGYGTTPRGGVEVTFRSSPESVVATFDARMLGRAVRNLLENALRASPEKGVVGVAIQTHGDSATIEVVDDGPGVEPALLPRIFDPYFSTHDSGTGLGLPIARQIAEEHGGRITARNRSDGGLEVSIHLPLG